MRNNVASVYIKRHSRPRAIMGRERKEKKKNPAKRIAESSSHGWVYGYQFSVSSFLKQP